MLGFDLCRELSGSYDVTALDMAGDRAPGLKAGRYVQCDITNGKKTGDNISDIGPDVIIHTAAWTDVDGCETDHRKAEKINIDGTRNICASAENAGAVLLYLSTDFVFDGKKNALYTESDIPNPLNFYGKTKLEGEKMAGTLDRYLVIRTSWLYGSHGRNFVDTIIQKAETENALRVVDDQIGSPTYTVDLTRAIAKLLQDMDKVGSGIVHVANKDMVSWFDYAREILTISGLNGIELNSIKSSELDRPAKRPAFSVLDTYHFETMTGYSLRNWKEALKEYIHVRQ